MARIGFLAGLAMLGGALAASPAAAESDFNVDKVLEAAKRPKPNLVLLAAHRGVWENLPENSRPAILEAVRQDFETIEIDVRLNVNQTPWLVHDYALDRTTSGEGPLSINSDIFLAATHILMRDGSPSDEKLLKLEDALRLLGQRLRVRDGQLRGFVLVIDLKSPPANDVNHGKVRAYEALKRSWDVVKRVSAEFPGLNRPGQTGPALGQAIIFKLRAAETPAPAVLEQDLSLAGITTFHMEPVIHPGKTADGLRVIEQYLDKPYNTGFEVVMEQKGQDDQQRLLDFLQAVGRTIPAFPSWNDYPEGVAKSSGICCLNRNTDPLSGEDVDYTGSFDFALEIGGNWLTSDIAPFLHDYLTGIGQRDLNQIK